MWGVVRIRPDADSALPFDSLPPKLLNFPRLPAAGAQTFPRDKMKSLAVEVVDPQGVHPTPAIQVVVVDVLRATSTLLEALSNGARSVLPMANLEDARRLAADLGRQEVVLCGERDGLPPCGFDLGNSPGAMTPRLVAGKPIVMTTTNGTAALEAARGAGGILTGCFGNRMAVARHLSKQALALQKDACAVPRAGYHGTIEICCAGRLGGSGEDDELFAAGLLAALVQSLGAAGLEPVFGARAQALLPRWEPKLESQAALTDALLSTEAGRWLQGLGFEDDVRHAAQLDTSSGVPVAREERVCGQLRQVLRLARPAVPESDPPSGSADVR